MVLWNTLCASNFAVMHAAEVALQLHYKCVYIFTSLREEVTPHKSMQSSSSAGSCMQTTCAAPASDPLRRKLLSETMLQSGLQAISGGVAYTGSRLDSP